MNDYIIGSGAILTPGPEAFLTPATIHAQTDPLLASIVQAAAFDFEGSEANLQRLMIAVPGWTARQFDEGVVSDLRARGEASLAQVLAALCSAAGTSTVHLFARWLPDRETVEQAACLGIDIVSHPLSSVERVSLVSGTRRLRWGPLRAA